MNRMLQTWIEQSNLAKAGMKTNEVCIKWLLGWAWPQIEKERQTARTKINEQEMNEHRSVRAEPGLKRKKKGRRVDQKHCKVAINHENNKPGTPSANKKTERAFWPSESGSKTLPSCFCRGSKHDFLDRSCTIFHRSDIYTRANASCNVISRSLGSLFREGRPLVLSFTA